MKRRQLIRYLQAGAIAATATGLTGSWRRSQAQTADALTIEYLGHTCFRFSSGGRRVLTNPFRTAGCTLGYPDPDVSNADVVLVSSFLLDEGAVDNVPESKVLAESGIFQLNGIEFEGIPIAHDRLGGRRFGMNTIWTWQQGGLNLAHLGGAAAPIEVEQRILIGRPDVALIPVGGGDKAYNPQEALEAIATLNPRIVIPTHYRTEAADTEACDLTSLENFLNLVEDTRPNAEIRLAGDNRIALSRADLPAEGLRVQVLTPPLVVASSDLTVAPDSDSEDSETDAESVRPTSSSPTRKPKPKPRNRDLS